MSILLRILTVILCALVLSTPACAQNENDETFRQIYYLQFVGIKTAMTSSSGAFFLDSQQGKLNRFKEVARKVAPESYVEGIQVKNIPDLNSVLFIFPEPARMPLCYFILVRKVPDKENSYQFYTYEKSVSLFDKSQFQAVVGGIDPNDGSHMNFGSRTFRDADSFVDDIRRMLTTRKEEPAR